MAAATDPEERNDADGLFDSRRNDADGLFDSRRNDADGSCIIDDNGGSRVKTASAPP